MWNGTPLSSRVVKGVSILPSSGGDLWLSLEVHQTSLRVVRGYSWFHSCRCRKIRPYLELRWNSLSFQISAGLWSSSRASIGDTGLPLRCKGKVGFPLESKHGNRPSSQDEVGNTGPFELWRETRGSSLFVTGISGKILS